MENAKLLIVDDERAIVEMMTTVLKKEGFVDIDCAYNGKSALEACNQKTYDLILLDIMMPDLSGLQICPFIRQTTSAPILFLTAKTSDLDALTGFAVGADDYIRKPFNPLEVVARIRAQLTRYLPTRSESAAAALGSTVLNSAASNSAALNNVGDYNSTALGSTALSSTGQFNLSAAGSAAFTAAAPNSMTHAQPTYSAAGATVFDYGHFQVDESQATLTVSGNTMHCPALVFQLLVFLCRHPNRVFSKSELYERVWGESMLNDDNTVMVHIHRIRERIEQDPANPKYLINVRGLGYKLVPPRSGGGIDAT